MSILNRLQEEVARECLDKFANGIRSTGLALPLGFGKTRLSVVIGLRRLQQDGPILVIASKTLLASWKNELDEVFRLQNQMSSSFDFDSFEYEIVHSDFISNLSTWKPKQATKLVLTTPDILFKGYSELNLNMHGISEDKDEVEIPTRGPRFSLALEGVGYFYSSKWGTLIIDEAHRYTNVTSNRCIAIANVYSKNRLALSGTMFDEPDPSKFLGFFVMMHIPDTPRSLSVMHQRLRDFEGYNKYIIHREDNEMFTNRPDYIEEIVSHDLSCDEGRVYQKLKDVLQNLNEAVGVFRSQQDRRSARRYSAFVLALITYIRQCLLHPKLIMSTTPRESELTEMTHREIEKLELEDEFFNAELSTRFSAVLEKVRKHRNDRVIIFSCFRSPLTLLQKVLDAQGYTTLTIKSKMSVTKRRQVLHDFALLPRGVMLLPYDIGAEGLNLQCANVVMLMDMWWNASKMQQGIGRIYRPGQLAKQIFVYIFVSNTAMESAIIKKISAKSNILDSLRNGSTKLTVPKVSVKDILNFILNEQNKAELASVKLK